MRNFAHSARSAAKDVQGLECPYSSNFAINCLQTVPLPATVDDSQESANNGKQWTGARPFATKCDIGLNGSRRLAPTIDPSYLCVPRRKKGGPVWPPGCWRCQELCKAACQGRADVGEGGVQAGTQRFKSSGCAEGHE